VATLHAAAEIDSPGALTFEHGSLTIQLSRPDSNREPRVAFPNRRVILAPGIMIRESSSGGVEDLPAGEKRTREFEVEKLFPLEILEPGEFLIAFSLTDGQHEVHPEPTGLKVVSRPADLASLFHVLDDEESAARRAKAAELLQRMTFQGLEYDANADVAERKRVRDRWETWWTSTGSSLPWRSEAAGASVGKMVPPPSKSAASGRLGGVFYRSQPPGEDALKQLTDSLTKWSASGQIADLKAKERVADQAITYPGPEQLFASVPELQQAILAALDRLTERVQGGEDQTMAALILLRTVVAAPSPSFAVALTRLSMLLPKIALCPTLAGALPSETES
jgi:hypothetical protein